MPRKLPEKARHRAERAVGPKKIERKHDAVPFEVPPVKTEHEIAEKI